MQTARAILLAAVGAAWVAAACSSFDSGGAPLSTTTPDSAADVLDLPAAEAGGADAAADTDAPLSCPDADLGADPANCGACGHTCLGGGCEAGACAPYRVVAAPRDVGAIGVTATGIHWVDAPGTDVRRCPPAGCPDGGAGVLTTLTSNAKNLAAFGETLAVAADNGVSTITTPGGISTPVGSFGEARAITAIGKDAFAFIHSAGGEPMITYRAPDGGTAAVPISAPSKFAIAAIDRQLYVYSGGSPERLFTCDVTDVANCANPRNLIGEGHTRDGLSFTRLAAANGSVFFLQPEQSRLEKCATAGCAVPSNLKMASGMTSIAADDTFVYFTTTSTVERCKHEGCGASHEIVARDVHAPHALTAAPNAMYWATDANGATTAAIWRLAR